MERLKAAIEKASAERERAQGAEAAAPPRPDSPPFREAVQEAARRRGEDPAAFWAMLPEVTLSAPRLQRNRIVTFEKTDPAHVAFDVLRTRVLKAMRDNGWTRLAITSPSPDCGKTFVAVNLALSLARQADLRTLLFDMDLRVPSVASTLGLREARSIQAFLQGRTEAAEYLLRVGPNLALGLNTQRVRDSAELIQARQTGAVLAETVSRLAPDMVIFDLPPMLAGDDALATLPYVDCVLLVAGAGQTKPEHIEACERLLEGNRALLGVLLNKAEDAADDLYGYG